MRCSLSAIDYCSACLFVPDGHALVARQAAAGKQYKRGCASKLSDHIWQFLPADIKFEILLRCITQQRSGRIGHFPPKQVPTCLMLIVALRSCKSVSQCSAMTLHSRGVCVHEHHQDMLFVVDSVHCRSNRCLWGQDMTGRWRLPRTLGSGIMCISGAATTRT